MSHPEAVHNPTVKAITPSLHGSSEERFDDVMIAMTNEDGDPVEHVGQLLLLFTFTYNDQKHDTAFIWWYDILPKDATTCHLVDRCYESVPGSGEVPHCQLLDLTDVLCRAHLIPCCQKGKWERSQYHFRLNRFIFDVP